MFSIWFKQNYKFCSCFHSALYFSGASKKHGATISYAYLRWYCFFL